MAAGEPVPEKSAQAEATRSRSGERENQMADENKATELTSNPTAPPAPKPAEPEPAGAKANAAFAKARLEAKQAQRRVEELEARLAEIEREKLSEEERIRKDLETFKPKAEQLDRYANGIKEILEIEIADVPEDKRDLIPNLDPLDKLKWVRTAKTKGLFAPPTPLPPPPKPGAAGASPAPGGGISEADRVRAELEKARKTGNPSALVSAMRRLGLTK